MDVQWFPGHMSKTRKLISENLKLVDLVIELLDARVPRSSQNPILPELLGQKPVISVLNKADMADAEQTAAWEAFLREEGRYAVAVSCKSGEGFGQLKDTIRAAFKDKMQREREKGMRERAPKLMVVGIPNVGKSSFINKLAGRAGAATGDRPGVTTGKQWIRIPGGFELLDTPGILWPKFEDPKVGEYLAFTGAIKDTVYQVEEAACLLCDWLRSHYPDALTERYGIDIEAAETGYDLLLAVGKRRGCVISGGEIDETRASHLVLEDFRSLRFGRITLESVTEEG